VTDRHDDGGVGPSVDLADVTGEDLAYVCYTSGSTGQPKGVMIPHRGVVRLVGNTNYIDIRPDDVFLQFAPLSFDASTFEIWGALLNGAKLVVYGPANVELGDLGRSIRDNKISTLWLTSALFNLMVDGELESLLGVRHLLAGGDVLSVPHVKKLLERMPAGHVLINGYGPTENTTFTCCHRMDRDSVINARVPIGIPVTGTDVVMVDEKGRPAPRNAAGEILVGGAGLARGYLKSPALDAEKFVSLAIQGGERRRFYRTGDLGAWNSDGTLDFRGRMDEQMKIRGFRVEPGEIEAALRGLEGIRDAAVALDEGDSGERQIRAFVVRDDTHLGVAAIKAGLQSALPDYMVPAAVHFLDALPVTPNGKVDRAALREMAVRSQNGSTTDPGNAPRDLLEHRLAAIWCRLFGRKDIGRDANFFELGGHSLLAAELAHEVEKLVGHRFPIARVFQAQTIAELAAMVEGEDWAPAWSSLVPLRAEGDKAPMFFVHGYGGDVYAFVHLVRAMEKKRPVYGLQAAESSGGIPPHETMEQMAAHYAKEIRSLQPEGPYHLAGYSLGGWIAYAVAQELRQSGQEVALLVLFDTAATANVPWYLYGLTAVPDFADRTLRHVRKLRQVPWSEIGNYLAGPLRTLRYLLSRSQREPETDYAKEMGWKADPWNLLHARYRPAPYGGKMIVFLASARADSAARPDNRIASRSIHALEEKGSRLFWKRMARGGVRFHRVPGTHHTILSALNAPHVAREIDDALTGQPPSPSLVAAGEGGGATWVHWFEEQVAKTPSAPAVQFGETCLTYRELDERVRRLASLFSAQGAGRGKYVAVLLERSIDLLPTLFAILRCGAAYVPLDPKLPEVRRRMMLEEVQPVLVATQSRFVSLLAGDPFPRVRVDDIGEDDPVAELPVRPSPQDAVYVIYTSGSTGRPKGVVVRHDSLSNLLHSIRKRVSFGGKEIFVSATAITWDGCLLELFLPLVCGAKLVLASEAQRIDPAALVNLVEESAATFFKATPTMWQMLVEFGWRGSPRLNALSGGEALSSDLVEALLRRTRALWNGYGPTETTDISLACHIKGGDKITIGTVRMRK
jgi:amino acid adenylation domain-containing protein